MNVPYQYHWARTARIERMRFARQVRHDPQRCAEWVAIARKMHRIYMSDRRSHEQHRAFLNGPKVNRDHYVPYANRSTAKFACINCGEPADGEDELCKCCVVTLADALMDIVSAPAPVTALLDWVDGPVSMAHESLVCDLFGPLGVM